MEKVDPRVHSRQTDAWKIKVSTGVDADVLEHSGEWDRDRLLAFGNSGTGTVRVTVRESVDGRMIRESVYTLPPGGHDFARVVGTVRVIGRVVHEAAPGDAGEVWAHFSALGGAELAGNVDVYADLPAVDVGGPFTLVGWTPARRHWFSYIAGGGLDLALVRADGVTSVGWTVTAGPSRAIVCPPSHALWARNPLPVGQPIVGLVVAWAV